MRPTEWFLAPQVAAVVFQQLGQPLIDLFTTKSNKQLLVYCTGLCIHKAEAYAMDALSISWEGLAGYAFPPIPLIHRVLEKIARESSTIILIAPFWPISLLARFPQLLPSHPDLLNMQNNSARFHDIKGLRLIAWPI